MNGKIYTYIEVKSYKDNKVVKRLDVTGKTQRSIESIENGLNINLEHSSYYTLSFDSKTKKEAI